MGEVTPTGRWVPRPSMDSERSHCAAVTHRDTVIVIGGADASERPLRTVLKFHLPSELWTSLPSMDSERSACAAVTHKDSVI